MNRTEQREAALKAARGIVDGAKSAGRTLSDEERAAFEGHLAEADRLEVEIAREKSDADLLARLDALAPAGVQSHSSDRGEDPRAGAKSLGEFFAKGVSRDDLRRLKTVQGAVVATPEFKAATDEHTTPGIYTETVLQTVDTSFVRPYRRPLISDLLGSGAISGTSIRYFIEAPIEGSPATVLPGGQKPQLHLADPTDRVDFVTKIAAWWDMQDEMVEDLPFWVSEINNRGLRLLSEVEEAQLFRGDGKGANLLGLLNREGVQHIAGEKSDGSLADTIYRAMTSVQSATGLTADGLIINPVDYQTLRLNKDGNGQYFGGGYFAGQYGNGGIQWQPDVWGLKTVVTAAADPGHPMVGAFKDAATIYRKGGVRVESTNSDRDKFTRDVVTTRIEERLALAVRYPSAIAVIDPAAA